MVLPIVGSDPKEVGECMPVLEAMTTVREREREREREISQRWWVWTGEEASEKKEMKRGILYSNVGKRDREREREL